jgi:polyisoprenoid-binding protein YceI
MFSLVYKVIFYCLSLLVTIGYEISESQVFTTKEGHVEFDSSVPLHSFTGTSDYLVGQINLDSSTVDFYLDLTTLETGIGKRDRDMLRTLEAEEYPFAEFYGKLVSEFKDDLPGPQKVTVEGDFTVHGVTRQVSIEGTLENDDDTLVAEASWIINMENYDIEPPGILFYRVSEEIKVRMNARLTPK